MGFDRFVFTAMAGAALLLSGCSPDDPGSRSHPGGTVEVAWTTVPGAYAPADQGAKKPMLVAPKLIPAHLVGQSAPVQALQRKVDRRLLELEGEDEPPSEGRGFDDIRDAIATEWRKDVAACSSDDCRIAALREQLNRLAFALGDKARPIEGIPWTSGSMHSHEGTIRILPDGEGKLFVFIDSADAQRGAWLCGLTASGRLMADGTAIMTPFETLSPGNARFLLRTRSPGQITIEPTKDAALWPYCGVGGSFLGTYKVSRRAG